VRCNIRKLLKMLPEVVPLDTGEVPIAAVRV
jgi:hypothetical protein